MVNLLYEKHTTIYSNICPQQHKGNLRLLITFLRKSIQRECLRTCAHHLEVSLPDMKEYLDLVSSANCKHQITLILLIQEILNIYVMHFSNANQLCVINYELYIISSFLNTSIKSGVHLVSVFIDMNDKHILSSFIIRLIIYSSFSCANYWTVCDFCVHFTQEKHTLRIFTSTINCTYRCLF